MHTYNGFAWWRAATARATSPGPARWDYNRDNNNYNTSSLIITGKITTII